MAFQSGSRAKMIDHTRLFVDTSYVLGLYNLADQFHDICVKAVSLTKQAKQLYITDAILMEVGNAFSSIHRREQGGKIIRSFLNFSRIQVVHLSPEYFEKALTLYERRIDKEWGMVDCFSFVVMKDLEVKFALTIDHHFKQAGFQILPF